VIGAARWRDNVRIVGPPGATRVELGRSRARRRAALRTVADLPTGAAVVFSTSAPGAARRSRAFAAEAGLEIECEYLALPTASAPAYLVEVAPAPVGVFVEAVLVAPPGIRLSAPAAGAVSVIRALGAWRVLPALAPGRVVVARRR
jgi:hypothetical protein